MNIVNRLIGYFLVIGLFLIAGVAIESNLKSNAIREEVNVPQVQKVLQEKIDSLKSFETTFNSCLSEPILNNRTANNYFQKKEIPVGGSVFVFDQSTIVFWNDNKCPIDSNSFQLYENHRINRIGNGYYYVDKTSIKNRTIVYCLFIRSDFNIQNQYLENNYNSNLQVCNHREFSINAKDGFIPIHYNNDSMFFISSKDDDASHHTSVIVFILFLFAYLLVNISLIDLTFVLGNKRGWIGLMPVILLFIIRYWMIAHSWPNAFYSTSYFSPSVYASSAMLNSPLDLLFGVLCLLSLIIFFYSLITSEKIITRALSKQSIARAVFAMLIFLCFAYSYVINYLLNGLILNSQISFNTNNIFDLDTYSLIGFFVIGIVLTGFYFISIGTTYYIRRLGIKITSALLYFTCIALVFGLITKLSIGFYFSDAYTYYSFGFAFLLILFIIYVRVYFSKGFKQESIIFIVLGFSVYATLQIYSFNQIKESERQRSFANKIQSQKDNIADYLFDETKNKIKQDSIRVYQTATSLNNYEELNKFLINSYFSDYFSSYDITFYYLDKNGNCLNSASDESLNEIVKEYTYQSNGLLNYSGKLEKLKQYGVISTRFTNQITTCVVEFSNKRVGNGDGFPELLLSNKVNATKDLNDYSFARYKEGKLLYQSGSFNYYITSVPYEEDIKKSDAFFNNGYYHIILKDNSGLTIISRRQKSFLEIITLFSYLFAFFSLAYLIGYVIYQFYHNDFNLGASYNNRIKITIVSFVIFTLIISGITTIIYIITNNNESEVVKSQQTIKDLTSYLENTFENTSSIDQLTVQEKSELYKLNKTIHTDFSIYNLKGYLVFSTQPRIFDQALIGPMMNKTAYFNLKNLKLSGFYQTENIGKLAYRSTYRPVYNRKGEQCAYLNINYFFTEKQVKAEISKFLIALINLYVFLFTISILIAVFISNKITAPLKFIQDSFKKTRLNAKNNLVSWNKKDEIGALVNEYNRMLMALQKSAEDLAQSERESAWREMAKQVAHEIKNPLTPMKLGIQHMLRVIESSQDNREEVIRKISSGLIEQIDNLSNIASAFSDFAKMPQAEYEEINLRDLIKNTIVLFRQSETIQFENNTDHTLPNIIGDKNQIIRILNNLFRNAQQSMEESANGLITIDARTEGLYLIIKIKDNGKGIPEDLKEKIFVPYFTTKSSGTGLGLAIVKNMMMGMKGDIRFESEENKGTAFELFFRMA